MTNYPEVVTKIADDYLQRVRLRLRLLPTREQDEFVMELRSHLYEAYQQTSGLDETARILTVLRNLGEPAEVVSDRLPGAMMRSGTKRNLPLYILTGIIIALFGIPLGFSGVSTLFGLLVALAGVLIAFYAVAGSILFTGALFMLLGLARICLPALWDKLLTLGFIQINGPVGDFFNPLSPVAQGLILMVFSSVFIASGCGMLWLGKHMLRGLRLLFGLAFDGTRRLAQTIRRKLRRDNHEAVNVSAPLFGKS
jgi:uncharacterized membrane protein